MKLLHWLRSRTTQEKLMIATIALLVIFIATRWSDIAHTAGTAFRDRFIPPSEQTDSTRSVDATDSANPA